MITIAQRYVRGARPGVDHRSRRDKGWDMESLTVPGTLDSLRAIRDYVTAAAAAVGLEERVGYRLRLAVDEIATNIITHGYGEAGREGVVELRADFDEENLTICVEDTGIAYDPLQYQDRDDIGLPLEQRETGGLGVYLAVRGVDEFIYERVGDRNRHTFVVHRIMASAEDLD